MEKRKFLRVIFHTEAIIKLNKCEYKCEVKDLSLKGAYLQTNEKINVENGQIIDISFFLSGTTSELNLNMKSIVFRTDETGLGIKFETIDLDSFIYLKNIIAYNSGNLEQVMDEFYESGLQN